MEQRYFDLDQAARLLPQLEQWLETIVENNRRIQTILVERTEFAEKVANAGGIRVDVAYWIVRKEEQETLTAGLQYAGQAIEDSGCIVKDIDMGLIDFPCELEGEEFYLCWRLGEPSISFWHGTHKGFGGRKAIDAEMMARLNGSKPI